MQTIISSIDAGSTSLAFNFRHSALGVAAFTALSCVPASAAPPVRSAEGPWAQGRVLVSPKAGLSEDALGKIVAAHGAKVSKLTGSGLYLVELPANASERAVAAQLAHNPHLKFAELDQYVPRALVPNDTYFGSAWHLAKIGAPTAWDTSQGANVTIAVLDTGVLATHPDLAGNLVAGWNTFKNTSDTSDFMGHGTPVAGAAAAITNNGTGVAGVAGRAKIMPLVVTDSTGGSYYSVISQAITWAADRGARVASISFSGLPFSSAVQNASQYMKNKGGLVVVAAGNTGAVDNVTPTSTMIPVSSTESNDTLSSFSTYGAFVAMSAPGSNIYSTSWAGGYGVYGGTSLATPIVSGTIALMMAANPALSATEIESLLYKTAVDLGAAGRDPYFGYGRVDAGAAVTAALNAKASVNTADTTPPQVAIGSPIANQTVTGQVPISVTATDNVGVSKVELRVNGALVATDTSSPFAFSWDSTKFANGMANLVATAYDAAGNSSASNPVAVNVANASIAADTTPPTVTIVSPTLSAVTDTTIVISDSASDNSGAANLSHVLYINGKAMASGTGTSISYKWNTRGLKSGTYTLQFVVRDLAGNTATATTKVVK